MFKTHEQTYSGDRSFKYKFGLPECVKGVPVMHPKWKVIPISFIPPFRESKFSDWFSFYRIYYCIVSGVQNSHSWHLNRFFNFWPFETFFAPVHLSYFQTEMKWSGSYLAVSTHTWDLSTSSMRHVWLSVHGFSDQRWKRSCLAGASTCFWTQCTEYLPQVTQSAQFQLVLGMATLFFTGTRETFIGKNRCMLV